MNIVQVKYQNPSASMPLIVPVLVMPNTPVKVVNENIRENSKKDLQWLDFAPAHDWTAILCGGGPSIKNHIGDIKRRIYDGGTVFAANGAAKWLADQGIEVDYQTILDAKQETSTLVEPRASKHLFSSQCHQDTVDAVKPILFHLNNIDIEDLFPEERVNAGGYTLVGGGVSVGITTLIIAYVMGFRKFHIFGYDSSHEESTHAYEQTMNQFIPNCEVSWGERVFTASMPMKAQAEAFPTWANELIRNGCKIEVYGDGLLQSIWKYPPTTEKQKYKMLWANRLYRLDAPGERLVDQFIELLNPKGRVIDFGCGTGRAAKRIAEKTDCSVTLVDFADNCRDVNAQYLPFLEWDLTETIPLSSQYGFCTDVMEHIPTDDVKRVIGNILDASPKVFFQISTVEDNFGDMINSRLHLTVKPHSWWKDLFIEMGYKIEFDEEHNISSIFVVRR